MESNNNNEIAYEFLPYFRAYKDGRVERFFGVDRVPTSTNPNSTVSSKDVVVSPESAVSARLFKPTTVGPNRRLPVLVYFHGGAYCFGSPFCAEYHNHLTSLVAEANVIAISVDYRLAPEYPIPIAYEDSWAALKWVASHCNGQGPENWINDNADLRRVFVAGDSAGANIAHNTAMKAGEEELAGLELNGACLVHPDFASKEGHVPKAWFFACPDTTGASDPRINPAVDSRLGKMRCRRALVCVAEKDWAKEGGLFYYEKLRKSGWTGAAEIVETEGEGHVFHLFNPNCENAVNLVKRLAYFINQE